MCWAKSQRKHMGLNNANKGGEWLGCCSTHRRLQRRGAPATLASFNQDVQGTKFSFILGHRNPQQASWAAANHCNAKGLQKRLWCNSTKHGSNTQVWTRSALWQQDSQQCQARLDAIPRMWLSATPALSSAIKKGARLWLPNNEKAVSPALTRHIMSEWKDDLEKKNRSKNNFQILGCQALKIWRDFGITQKKMENIELTILKRISEIMLSAIRLVWSRRRKKD